MANMTFMKLCLTPYLGENIMQKAPNCFQHPGQRKLPPAWAFVCDDDVVCDKERKKPAESHTLNLVKIERFSLCPHGDAMFQSREMAATPSEICP